MQVNGGTEFEWPERIVMDVWYVEHQSLWLDLKIAAKTFGVVLFGEKPNVHALREAERFAGEHALRFEAGGELALAGAERA